MILGALLTLAALSASADELPPVWLRTLTEAAAALEVDASGCPRGVEAETVLADYAAGRLPRLAADEFDARLEDLRLLYSCRAVAAGSAKACDPLGAQLSRIAFEENRVRPAARPDTLRFLCASDLQDMRMARAMSEGSRKDFIAACLEHDAVGHHDFLPGHQEQACSILAAGGKDPAGTCAKLAPLYSSGLPGTFCEGEISFFAGEAAHCGALTAQQADRELCQASAAFRARRENPDSCAASPVCAAMSSGKAGACAVYEGRALAGVCREHYLPRALDAAERKLSDLDRELAASGGASRRDAASLDAALERAARLRVRAEALRASAARVAAPVDLGRVEDRLALFERAAQFPGRPSCLSRASSETALALLTEPETSPKARAVLLSAILPSLERLYNARAFTTGGTAICDDLAPLRYTVSREKNAGDISLELLCKTNYYEGLMAGAMIRGEPEIFELCRTRNLIGDRDFRLDSLDVSCRIIAERAGGVAATCERLTPYFDNGTIGGTCPRMLRYALGDETVCAEFVDPMVHDRCEGYAAYRKAAPRSPKACDGKAQCLMLAGDAKGPEAAAAAGLARASCEVYARPEIRAEFGRRLAAQAETAAQALAARPREDAGGRAAARDEDAALERVARLQARALRLAEVR